MGYDNNLLAFFRDGANEGVALTILGSLRSLQQQYPPNPHPHTLANEYSQQTEGDNTMIDRAAATRDRDRERVSRTCRNADVRYMKSLRCLRDRLSSSFSCSGRRCPMIKERFEQHQLELHSSPRAAYKCDKTEECNLDESSPLSQRDDSSDLKHQLKCDSTKSAYSHSSTKSTVCSEDEPNERNLDKSTTVSRCSITKAPGYHQLDPRSLAQSSVAPKERPKVSQLDKTIMTTPSTNEKLVSAENESQMTTVLTETQEIQHPLTTDNHNSVTTQPKIDNFTSILNLKPYEIESISVGTEQFNNLKHDNCNYFGFNTNNITDGYRNNHSYVTDGITTSDFTNFNDIDDRGSYTSDISISLTSNDINEMLRQDEDNDTSKISSDAKCIDKLSSTAFNTSTAMCSNERIEVSPFRREASTKNVVTEVTSAVLQLDQVFDDEKLIDTREIRRTITEGLRSIYQKTQNNNIVENMSEIADFIIVRVNPLLNKPIDLLTNSYKLILRTALVNIIKDLPDSIDISYPKYKELHIRQLAVDLADRLLSVQAQFAECNTKTNISTNSTCSYSNSCGSKTYADSQRETVVNNELKNCVVDSSFELHDMVIEEAGAILVDFFTMPDKEKEDNARNELIDLFVTTTNLSEVQAIHLTDVLIEKINNVINKRNIVRESESKRTCNKTSNSITSSVYTSIEKLKPLNYPLVSAHKKKLAKKTTSKLNPQEIQYMEKVANLIRAWMSTLPKSFNAPEEKNFKETMIYDLAGDIMDEAKLKQLTPGIRKDEEKYLKYYVARWIYKLGAFEVADVDPQIETFLAKLKEIPVPTMTQPQHGNRQVMANTKYRAEANWHDHFLPKETDIIQDEISIWMNEQPSDIFINKDKEFKQKKIHELAHVLENKHKNKNPKTEISRVVAKWLNKIVKPDRKHGIDELTKNLKDRLIDLPQDATLAAKLDKKLNENAEYKKEIDERDRKKLNASSNNINDTTKNETADQENTMKMFISKFIEHNYDVDDPLARRAFNRLLKTHLQRINTPVTRKEIYDNFSKNEHDDRFPPQKLIQELKYIKVVSDWLKNLPLNASYNTLGNRDRIDFVNSLAISIREIEEERQKQPDAMDYQSYMSYMILEFMHLLPIPEQYLKNVGFMINQLLTKIVTHREDVAAKLNESANTTGVNAENFGDFIEEFIRINGDDIAQDEVKLEAWAIRLIREVKKIVRTSSHPSVLSKAHIYNKLADVPKPGDETANIFSLELDYIKEITNWLKNLPLLPENETEKDDRTRLICQLAEKITEMERNKANNPTNSLVDSEFKEYLAEWISNFPLDKRQEIVMPIVIEQLMNRIQKAKQKDVLMELDFPQSFKILDNTLKVKKSKGSFCQARGKSKRCQSSCNLLENVIEKWANDLPFNESLVSEDAKINMKKEVSRKLFQKVGQLNMDPRAYNDDLLYKEILADEIDLILENLPITIASQVKKQRSETDIINAIIETKNNIKEKTAGSTYKQKLDGTIEASIPNPISIIHVYEPGFEIYKDRLIKLFILENFDHGTDLAKINYERRLKKEIYRYFESAKRKNAVPISKNQLYLELYCNLFKVPVPNEASITEEVEEVKTRCEIDAWFEELPLREANGLSELLEWDKILSTLAKRIHEIEILQSPNQHVFKEIMKWIVKLPLLPGNESKHKEFAERLQNRLKSTVDQRKCVLESPKSNKGKKRKEKAKERSTKKPKEEGQFAGSRRSSNGKLSTSPSVQAQQLPVLRKPRTNAADKIYEIVQTWCDQIPVSAKSTNDTQMLKDNLVTKIIIKIGEMNTNTNIFNNDILYDKLLDEELDILLSALPMDCDFQNSKAARKYQLLEAIKETKPLILGERAHHRYKQELNDRADKILRKPQNMGSNKEIVFDEVKKEIIDDFIQYEYNINDDESKQIHKKNIENNISKLIGLCSNSKEVKPNLLMKTNQLICELEMVSETNSENVINEVEEILMKKELSEFFDEFILPGKGVDKPKMNNLKGSLAKKLNEIEICGHTLENESKMKIEIVRCLNKLNMEINHADIDAFICKLKNNEPKRRKLPVENLDDVKDMKNCHEMCQRNLQILGKQSQEAGSVYKKPVNSIASASSASINNDQTLEIQSDEGDRTAVVSNWQDCGENMEIALTENENLANKPNEDHGVYDHEAEKRCSCYRRFKCCRRRPYDMVPMRHFYNCHTGYPYWCKMSLPGFYR